MANFRLYRVSPAHKQPRQDQPILRASCRATWSQSTNGPPREQRFFPLVSGHPGGYDTYGGDFASVYLFGEGRESDTEVRSGDAECAVESLEEILPPLTHRLIVTTSSTVPAAGPVLLVGEPPAEADEQHILRRAWRFPERSDGSFAEEFLAETAIDQLQDRRRGGATHLIIPMTAFGWIAMRPALDQHLEGHYRLLVDDAACRVFDLRRSPIGTFLDSILPPDEPVIAVLREGTELELEGRAVHRTQALEQIEALRSEGLRFLVVADMNPWAPEDAGIVSALERRYRKLVTRPGLCELFDLAENAASPRDRRTWWRRWRSRGRRRDG